MWFGRAVSEAATGAWNGVFFATRFSYTVVAVNGRSPQEDLLGESIGQKGASSGLA
jgi:hypothetical protein